MFNALNLFLKKHVNDLQKSQQRMAVVLHVKNNPASLNRFIEDLLYRRKLIISPVLENGLLAERAATKLGEEYDLVVFDAREIFNPDALGVISGVLCGGGCLLVLLPDEEMWVEDRGLFLSHIDSLLNNQSGVYYFKNKSDIINETSKEISLPIHETQISTDVVSPYRTLDQQLAVELIVNAIQEYSQYCCVLTSGRGRGKSSALGYISAELLKTHSKIIICAPRLSVADTLFEHLQKQCPEGEKSRAKFEYKSASVNFMPPDLLLEQRPEAEVLLIDEAAVIPLSMLERLLDHYPKIIFSTTTHGYEGTGRGFVLKFYKLLDKVKPGWEKIELHQPIRWSRGDPLEKWIESLLFLDLKLVEKPVLPVEVSLCQVKNIDRERLLKNKEKLAAVFSLLVFAHYRTSPSDFQYLLNDENIRIYALEYKNNVLAVVVVNQEGGFDSDLSTAIYRGERRPKGNLLAQTLCFHGGVENAASLIYSRVMRIAVHPELQQKGLGGYLVGQVIKAEQEKEVDVLGTSFSATVPLLNFWNKADLSMLRIGFSRDHVTASHSAVMARPLSADGEKVIQELSIKFNQNIFLWLQGPLSELSADIKNYICLSCEKRQQSGKTNLFDLNDVESFAKFNRNYDACMPAITRYINSLSISDVVAAGLSEQEQQIIPLSVKYMNDWKAIVSELKLDGKAQANKLLRVALSRLLDNKDTVK